MKILVIHNEYKFKGGEDLVVDFETKLLKSAGHDVTTLLFQNANIDKTWRVVTLCFKSIYNFHCARKINDLINTFHPDIVHVHNLFYKVSPSVFFVTKRKKIPVVVTLHNYRLICPSATLLYKSNIYEQSIHKLFPIDAIVKGVFQNSSIKTAQLVLITAIHKLLRTWTTKVDGYIVFSEFAKKQFLHSSLNASPSQFFTKPNFVYDHGYKLSERENFFLFIGRLSTEKGIELLLKSVELLPKVQFRIIGDGPLMNLVRQYALTHPNVSFLGYKAQQYIIDQLKSAKALIFPSIWYEGMPLTILEAFSCGTPVIASDIGIQNEMVTDGVNGLSFQNKSSIDLTRKILQLLNYNRYHEMCLNARISYERNYTPEKNLATLTGIYQQLIEKNNTITIPPPGVRRQIKDNSLQNGNTILSKTLLSDV